MSKTILFIHGMQGTGCYWHAWADYFTKQGYTCLAPTLPMHCFDEHRLPDPKLGELGMRDYVEALKTTIAGLDEKPICIGHSMGGLLALMLSAEKLAAATVMVTPAAPAGIHSVSLSVLRSFISLAFNCCFWKKPFKQSYREAKYAIMNRISDEAARKLYSQGVWESGRVLFEIGFWWLDRAKTTHIEPSDVTNPLLIVGSGQDRITPIDSIREIAARYPNADYFEYPEHAHWIIGETGWEDVCGDIADWLSGRTAN